MGILNYTNNNNNNNRFISTITNKIGVNLLIIYCIIICYIYMELMNIKLNFLNPINYLTGYCT